jgi:hypothetical protein
MPFYGELAAARGIRDFQIVVVGGESEQSLADFVQQHDLAVERVVAVARGGFRTAVTPTLVVVDRGGIVRGAWTGLLGEREGEVRRLLGIVN